MFENVEVLKHSSIKFSTDKVIYFDPFDIREETHDADFIFITHDHYDHYSEDDIRKVMNNNTIIIVPECLKSKVLIMKFNKDKVFVVKPNYNYIVNDLIFETICAYNINKKFHPKENNWVGYIIEINGIRYYIAGDTDITEENKKVKCDVAFVPVGGTFTMNSNEAAELINIIRPKVAVPIHYGSVVGTKQDAINFEKMVDKEIKCYILMK